jgi:hypothetical protein
MPKAEFYRQKADECVVAAKTATLNEERARHYALAEHYMRLAMEQLKRDPNRTSPSRSINGHL